MTQLPHGRQYNPFNPLDKGNLGESVLSELLKQPVLPMPRPRPLSGGNRRQPSPTPSFIGAGVYAIYYIGEHAPFPPYDLLAIANRDEKWGKPLYVGKADPKGSRSGQTLTLEPGTALFDRLVLHSESIEGADNLALNDFFYRALTVDDAFIGLGEVVVIQQLSPLWNSVGQGFGSKVVGSGRSNQKRSRWDTLHPGRPGMGQSEPKIPLDRLIELISLQLAGAIEVTPLPEDEDDTGEG
ncbi:MAG: Eco29kI family restriction endonuclease [Thermomicrobiales bacterium]